MRLTLLAIALLTAASLHAQGPSWSDSGSYLIGPLDNTSPSHFTQPDPIPNPRFPLRIALNPTTPASATFWGYKGKGELLTPDRTYYTFKFSCNASLDFTTYQARWLQPNRKLQIRVYDPSSRRHGTCTLTTMAQSTPPPTPTRSSPAASK